MGICQKDPRPQFRGLLQLQDVFAVYQHKNDEARRFKNSKQFADVFILLPVLIDKGLFSFFGYFSLKLSVFFVTPADL